MADRWVPSWELPAFPFNPPSPHPPHWPWEPGPSTEPAPRTRVIFVVWSMPDLDDNYIEQFDVLEDDNYIEEFDVVD